MEAAPEASEAALGIEYLNKGITVIKWACYMSF